MAENIPKSFRLSNEAVTLLKKMADLDKRTETSMLEVIIAEAAKARKVKAK